MKIVVRIASCLVAAAFINSAAATVATAELDALLANSTEAFDVVRVCELFTQEVQAKVDKEIIKRHVLEIVRSMPPFTYLAKTSCGDIAMLGNESANVAFTEQDKETLRTLYDNNIEVCTAFLQSMKIHEVMHFFADIVEIMEAKTCLNFDTFTLSDLYDLNGLPKPRVANVITVNPEAVTRAAAELDELLMLPNDKFDVLQASSLLLAMVSNGADLVTWSPYFFKIQQHAPVRLTLSKQEDGSIQADVHVSMNLGISSLQYYVQYGEAMNAGLMPIACSLMHVTLHEVIRFYADFIKVFEKSVCANFEPTVGDFLHAIELVMPYAQDMVQLGLQCMQQYKNIFYPNQLFGSCY